MITATKPTGPIIGSVDRPVSFTMNETSPRSGRVEPITLEQTKLALRITSTSTSEDDLLRIWIAAARELFENITGRQIINATWEYALDQPPAWNRIELPRPPLISIETVAYDDADGVEQTFSGHTVLKSGLFDGSPESGVLNPYCGCGAIEVASASDWPTTSGLGRSFRVRRTCGYGATADEVPGLIKGALYFLVGHFYRNRTEVTAETLQQVPMGADILMRGFKYTALPTLPPRTA